MVLPEVIGYCLVYVELTLTEDAAAEFVLFHSQLDVVEEHLIDHFKDVVANIFLIHLKQVELLGKLSQLVVRGVQQLFGAHVLVVVPSQFLKACELYELEMVLQRFEYLLQVICSFHQIV